MLSGRRPEEEKMKTSDFYYDLPQELIAQTPLKERSKSRMMVLDKDTGSIEHKSFENIIEYLKRIQNDSLLLFVSFYSLRLYTILYHMYFIIFFNKCGYLYFLL